MIASSGWFDPNAFEAVLPFACFALVGSERSDAGVAVLVNMSVLVATSTCLVVHDDNRISGSRSRSLVECSVIRVE